jgi:hypothetical protein
MDARGPGRGVREIARPDVEIVTADIARYPARVGEYAVVVCMGDTLTHLAS